MIDLIRKILTKDQFDAISRTKLKTDEIIYLQNRIDELEAMLKTKEKELKEMEGIIEQIKDTIDW